MAIEAITSIRNNNSNNVHFEARKNKKSAPVSNPTTSGTLKAVPLAVLLAMSPITTTNAESIMHSEANSNVIELSQSQNTNQVIESKAFENDQFKFKVSLERDSRNGNSHKIRIFTRTSNSLLSDYAYDGYVTNINNVNYGVFDDTGKKVSQFNYKHVTVNDINNEYTPQGISNNEVCQYVEQLLTKYNIDIKRDNRNFSLKMTPEGLLKHLTPSTNWLKETTGAYTSKYGKIYNTGDIQTEDGPYRVYMHSTDGDDKNFEAVSIVNKDGTIRHRVSGIVACCATVAPILGNTTAELELHQINLIDPQGRQQTICNKELWNVLLQLSKVSDYNNAFSLKDVRTVHLSTDYANGKLAPADKLSKL